MIKINCATSFDCVSLMCTLLRQVTLLTPNTVFAGCFLASQVAKASTGEQQDCSVRVNVPADLRRE